MNHFDKHSYAWFPTYPGGRLDGIYFGKNSAGEIIMEVCAENRNTMHFNKSKAKRLTRVMADMFEYNERLSCE
jgi:hypothetical protein